MKLHNASIDILVSCDTTTINIRDNDARILFASVKISPEQLSQAFSRQAFTKVLSCDIMNIDKIGKKHECKEFIFKVPKEYCPTYKDANIEKIKSLICFDALKKQGLGDWEPDISFSSRDSFFKKDGVDYARTTIRRWV